MYWKKLKCPCKIVNPVPLKFDCYGTCECREKKLSCTFISEHSTQLVPPAKKETTKAKKEIIAQVEMVCDKAVVICGVIRKKITYQTESEERFIIDEVPFQCLIKDDRIMKGDRYKITEKKIFCDIDRETNFKKDSNGELSLAFEFIEKDIVKISVKRVKNECK